MPDDKKVKLVNSYQYTKYTDLQFAKRWIMENGMHLLIVSEDYHDSGWCAGCGGSIAKELPEDKSKIKRVRRLYYGRLAGVEICDNCYLIEKEHIDKIMSVDLDITYVTSDDEIKEPLATKYPSQRFVKKKKKYQTKDEAYRELLEKEVAQQRLF